MQIFLDYDALSRAVAARIAALVRAKPDAVLGLATGSTPIGVYRELIRLHATENLDFSRVTTFNLDEYFPIEADAPQSYRRFMREQLWSGLNIAPENCCIPDGTARSPAAVESDCAAYEAEIRRRGGLDLQLLGIGRSGHIGFNEPGSALESRTRLVTLDYLTRADAATVFFGLENVPVRAITMGIATIIDAREIILMASGARKAPIIARAWQEKITAKIPASLLREHPNCEVYLDEAAAAALAGRAQPWRAAGADFADAALRERALIGIALENQTTLAQITPADLERAGAGALASDAAQLARYASEVAAALTAKTDDEAHLPQGQTVLCLSPHPDDDVICCGATLLKLAARGNQIWIAYGVSGANAVRDKDVFEALRARHTPLIAFLETHLKPQQRLEDALNEVRASIFERAAGAPDAPLLRELKRLVRQSEAANVCRIIGARPLFWNLPFYNQSTENERAESGRGEVGSSDVEIALESLRRVRPDLVLTTGEFNDPHGTHAACARAFEGAARLYASENGAENGAAFEQWSYRGAWDEWPLWAGGYFSVFDKALMERKIELILEHVSQLDPVFPGGSDPREFFERARERNRDSARELQTLGILPPSRSFAPLYAEVFQIVPTRAR